MDKMAQIIPVVQSWAILVLCVIMVIAALNMMKQPGKTQVTDENNFKVTEKSFWLVLAGFTVLIAAILIWMGVTHDNAGQSSPHRSLFCPRLADKSAYRLQQSDSF